MAETHTRIDESLHEKMKSIAIQNKRKLKEEYDIAITTYIQMHEQQRVIEDSMLEKMLDEKISKIDKHISSMVAKNSLDTSMLLVGLVYFLENYFEKDATHIYNLLREDGVKYFTNKSEVLKRANNRFDEAEENEF